MISENNKMARLEQTADREQHFGIRKLTVGAASILLGTTLWLGTNTNSVKADTVDDSDNTQAAEQAKTEVQAGAASSKKVVVVANQNTQETDTKVDASANEKQESNTSVASIKQSDPEKQVEETKQSTQTGNNVSSEKSEKSQSVATSKVQANNNVASTDVSASKNSVESETQAVDENSQSQDIANTTKTAAQVQVENGKLNTLLNQNQASAPAQSSALTTIQKSAQAGKSENQDNQDFDLSNVAMQGVKSNDKSLEKDLANVGIAKTKLSIENTKQANQIDEKNAKRIAQLYGISLAEAQNSVAASSEVQNQLKDFKVPEMNTAQLQQVISKLGLVISDPNVQSMAKDLIRGNWNGVLKDGVNVGQKLINNLGGIQGIIQDVTGKIAGSDWQQELKKFNIPTMSQEQMQQVISKIGLTISDPNVQNMAKDLIRGNWNGVLKSGEAMGQKLINNLGGIQGIIQDVTGKIAGSDWQQELKKFHIPTMSQAQMQKVISKIGLAISDPNVQNLAKDLIRGNWNGVLKSGEAMGQKLLNNLGGIQGIIQSVTGKIAGSDWQKELKEKFHIPTMSQAQMQQVISKIGLVISDPNVQNMAKDLIRGNWNGVLNQGKVLGEKLINNLGGIQGIIQKVTTSIAQHKGTSWLDKLKNIVPSFVNSQKQAAQKFLEGIKSPAVKTLVSDVINGKIGKLFIDTIHYGINAIKQAYAKAQQIIKQVKQKIQTQVATIKTDIANWNKKIQTSSPFSWSIKLPKLTLPTFHCHLFGKRKLFAF